jgi:hypothetical protein
MLATRRQKLSYYEGMPMTSLNISLPNALKDYVEGQVATGDWGTPSELAGTGGSGQRTKIEIPVAEIRRKGLISALRERARRR